MPLHRKRLVAWIAACAVLLQALWPLLSHARPNDPVLQVALCTVGGAAHVQDIKIGKSTPLDERAASHGDHCKLCTVGDGKIVLDSAVDPVFPLVFRGDRIVTPQSSFPNEPPRLPVQPRAPPAVS